MVWISASRGRMTLDWTLLQDIATATLAGGGTALVVVWYLSKRLVEQALQRNTERFRTELNQRTEALKTELSIYAHEQNVTRSRVDTQRAEAISAVYRALRAWVKPASQLATGTPVVNADEGDVWRYAREQGEHAHRAGRKLLLTLADHAIYFDSPTYEKVARVAQESVRLTASFLRLVREAEAHCLAEESAAAVEEERKHLARHFEAKIMPLHQEIVSEFRRLLGIEREHSNSSLD